MSKKYNLSRSGRMQSAVKRLADDLTDFDLETTGISGADDEMLSLMVDAALNGVDIVSRYPSFYRKLLSNAELRQAFIDTLESLETEKKESFVALPQPGEPSMAFLARLPLQPVIHVLNKNKWQIAWQRNIEQLHAIFFPSKLAIAREINLLENSWFTLLRDDINIEGSMYSVLLECGLSDEKESSLAAYINVAVTLESNTPGSQFPVSVTLKWGNYHETIQLNEQGRVRFPDIPFEVAFDEGLENTTSAMDLMLEKGP
jgi:hypothetical protein